MVWPLIIIVYPLFHILRLSPATEGQNSLGRSGLRGSGSGLGRRWEWPGKEGGKDLRTWNSSLAVVSLSLSSKRAFF